MTLVWGSRGPQHEATLQGAFCCCGRAGWNAGETADEHEGLLMPSWQRPLRLGQQKQASRASRRLHGSFAAADALVGLQGQQQLSLRAAFPPTGWQDPVHNPTKLSRADWQDQAGLAHLGCVLLGPPNPPGELLPRLLGCARL